MRLLLGLGVFFLNLVYGFSSEVKEVFMQKEVICLSQMTAKEGKEEELQKALQKLVPLTLKEPGCIAYEILQDKANEKSFVMYERFKTEEDLEEHIQMPYIQKFIENEYESCVESHWDMDLQKP